MFHLIEATRFHLNGELTEHDLWLKQKFERVWVFECFSRKVDHLTIIGVVSVAAFVRKLLWRLGDDGGHSLFHHTIIYHQFVRVRFK